MFKSRAVDSKTLENNVGDAIAVPTIATTAQPPHPIAERDGARLEPDVKAVAVSCIGSGMSIIGNIECNGPAQVFGRVEGEIRASDLLIGDGAKVEGSVIAQDVTICGSVKGVVRATRVKLQSGGAVEGDIFHRSLSIEENALFEGTSRRVENPTDTAPDAHATQKKSQVSPTPPALTPLPIADLQRH